MGAINEFPDLTVEKRRAVSIARRLQDPLNELVKIDPKSIGVGQYQHDVSQKKLTESLDFTVSIVSSFLWTSSCPHLSHIPSFTGGCKIKLYIVLQNSLDYFAKQL